MKDPINNDGGAEAAAHLSPADLARRWGVSVGTLANKRSDGTSIPYLRLFRGARIAYRLSDVLAAEAQALVQPETSAA